MESRHKPVREGVWVYPTIALGLACLFLGASILEGDEPMRMRVTPAMSLAPGFLTVRVRVEAAPENRRLQVIAESSDFYRSSEVPLDGVKGVPLTVFEFRDLPSGLYHVTGVLIGVQGPRATASGVARVQPSAGR
jgi:hypothetical protein